MRSLEELVSYLQQRDIQLWVEGEKLRYNVPKGALTPDLRNELKERKAELLTFLQHAVKASDSPQLDVIHPLPRDGNGFPLSFNQEQLWIEDQLEGNKSIYNLPVGWRIFGSLNIPLLEQSFTELIRRHEALRTIFPTVQGSPVQKILPPRTIQFPLIDLQHIPQEQRDDEARRMAFVEIERPFDLAEGPLFRGVLFRLEPEAYIFVLSIHHIISDVWSVGILVQELSALYNAYWENKSSPLPELPIQYVDFASWQRQWLSGKGLETQLHFWKQQLAGIPPVLELPIDRRRTQERNFAHGVEFFWIDTELLTQLKTLSRKNGVTFFITMLAAFAVFLQRYSRQDDIVIGSPLAGRSRTELEPLIGFFINVLPFRIDLSGNPTFTELLSQVRKVTADVFAHQDVPFVKLVELVHPDRNVNYPPIFQVVIDLKIAMGGEPDFPELSIRTLKGERGTPGAAFDLTLALEETESKLLGALEYNKHLFEPATINRMKQHFQTLLAAIVTTPQQRISELSIFTEPELHQLLIEWNNTTTNYPVDLCIHQLFEAQVEKTPDATAVVFADQQLSYRALNQRANQLAHYLRKLGVGPEILVGICVERSIEMIVGILGILKAGGAYLPLDPAYPQERLAFMLTDAGASVLLTQQTLKARFPEDGLNIVCLDHDWEKIALENTENPGVVLYPENISYTIYTSGSTGKPKGTLIPHKGLLNLVFWHQQAFQVTAQDKATQLAGTAFDASVWEVWPYLSAGVTLHLIEADILISPERLRDWLIAKNITISFVPTPLAEELLALEWPDHSSLRLMLTGGDKLHGYPPPSLPFMLINNYGPTENSVVTTSCPVPTQGNYLSSPPIGRPISNTSTYILDANMSSVPVGVPGELYVSGVGLARGYLHRPDLTSEKFVPNPFSQQAGSRLYKTGDLVRYLPDGNIEFLGRIDHQVKIRGFRIELGEIEATLAGHPAVRDAVVIVREDQPRQKRLAAYIVPAYNQPLSANELRLFLSEKLPDYMVPTAYVMLDALPLTPNGKIDRRALPAPEAISDRAENIFVAPRTPVEEALVRIWKDVLKIEKISIHDDFFESGGHSLLAAQLTSKIQQQFNQNIPLSLLFEAPTIAQLAKAITQPIRTEAFSPLVPLQTQGMSQPFFAMHPGNGQVFCYTELVRQLGTTQRFYGLQAFGLDSATSPLTSVIDMARQYIQAVRAVQPQGPYLLGGFCIGGTIAYQMAQQLEQQGEQIALLILIDTLAPHLYERMQEMLASNDVQHFMVFSQELGTFFGKDLVPIYARVRDIDLQHGGIEAIRQDLLPLSPRERVDILFTCAQQAGIPLPEDGVAHLEHVIKVHRINARAIFEYTPDSYNVSPVVLLRARDNQMNQEFDRTLGWHKYVSEEMLRVEDVPGDHFSMLRMPHVAELAKTFSQILLHS